MTRLLSLFGLMRVSEHEDAHADLKRRLGDAESARDDFEARFKRAIADLEKQAGEIAEWRDDAEAWKRTVNRLDKEIESLRPDALAMRRKRQMDRDRRKGNG